jgi:hypothetical protein
MTPLNALNKLADGVGGFKHIAHALGCTKQNLYKLRYNLEADPAAEVPPVLAAHLAHYAHFKKIDIEFKDFCPSIARAAAGQFPLRFTTVYR